MDFGPYRLDGLLGRGGMGEVHRAHHRGHGRDVAVKLLAGVEPDPEFAARFRRESHLAASLNNPHVIPIHAFGEIDGRLYLEMRLVEGADLGEVLARSGPLPVGRALGLLAQAADALDSAHDAGLVHRDVKPSNLLVAARDFVYLVDFGIAATVGARGAGTTLTATGATVGTLAYMAPERFGTAPAGPAADVYGLACVLHECLTGAPPFAGDSIPALLHAHLHATPPRVTASRPDLPAALDDVLARGLAKDPADRPRRASDLVAAARAAVGAAPGGTRYAAAGPLPAPPRPVSYPSLPAYGPVPAPAPAARASTPGWILAASVLVALSIVLAAFVLVGAMPGSAGADATAVSGSVAAPAPQVPPIGSVPGRSDETGTSASSGSGTSATTGDLGLDRPISSPSCTGGFIVVVRSATDPASYRSDVRAELEARPDAEYLLTGSSCGSLATRSDEGTAIYAVYLGPFTSRLDACSARASVGGESYLRRLDDSTPVGTTIPCS